LGVCRMSNFCEEEFDLSRTPQVRPRKKLRILYKCAFASEQEQSFTGASEGARTSELSQLVERFDAMNSRAAVDRVFVIQEG